MLLSYSCVYTVVLLQLPLYMATVAKVLVDAHSIYIHYSLSWTEPKTFYCM